MSGTHQNFNSKLVIVKTETIVSENTTNINTNNSFIPFVSRNFKKLPDWLKKKFINRLCYLL